MQFEDPKSMLEAAAAKPERGVDPYALLKRGRRLRRARYAAMAAGLAVTVAGASASVGLITDRDRPRPAGTTCDAPDRTVAVFARFDASDGDVERLRNRLESDPDVERVELVPAEQTAELLRAFGPRSAMRGPNVPAQLRVVAVDERGAERIAALEGGAVGYVIDGFASQGLECLREEICNTPASLEASVFLRDGAAKEEVLDLRERLLRIPEIEHVEYVSKKEAYRELKSLYPDQPHLYETLSPADLPASVRVSAATEEALQAVAETTSPAIDEVRWGGDLKNRLCDDATVTKTPGPSATEPATTSDPAAEVALLRQECGTSLPGLGRARFPNGEEGIWCGFVLRVDNQGEVPVVLDPERQRLAAKTATRLPWQAKSGLGTRLFDPISPGASRLGQLVFLLGERDAPVALELEIAGISRPIQFGVDGSCVAEVARGDSSVCAVEHEFPTSYLIRGYTLEGSAEVELYHCGVMPIAFDKRSWIADPPPFDATNAPEGFVGRGRMITELGSLSATYVDESGASFELEAVEDWEQPPCN